MMKARNLESKASIYNSCRPFKHTIIEIMLKNQHIWLRTLGEEAFGVTLLQ